MPPSVAETPGDNPPGMILAITAESLYLVNLLLLPGVAFLILLVLFFKHHRGTPPLALSHLEQTFSASLWGGVLLVVVNLFIILLGGYDGPYTWVIVILYFTICHSCLILLGMLGLAKAMSGKCFRYPLIGRTLPVACRSML